MNALHDAWVRYGPTAIGLSVGTAAKYGLAINDGKPVTWRVIVADVLLLGLLGLIAVVVSDWLGLTGNAKVLAGAMTAVSSDRLVRLMRRKFEQRIASEIDHLPTARLARLIGGEPPTDDAEFQPLLDKLDAQDLKNEP